MTTVRLSFRPGGKDIATVYRSWLFWPIAFDAPFPQSDPSGFADVIAEAWRITDGQ